MGCSGIKDTEFGCDSVFRTAGRKDVFESPSEIAHSNDT